ncbi:MAG: hypothetical protein ABIH82_06320 [Candidatus Woesearchaeota archaeon]
MKSYIFLILIIIFSTAVFAETPLEDAVYGLSGEISGQQLPKPVAKALGDQRINMHVTLENSEELIIGIVIEAGTIKNLVLAEAKDPSFEVYTTESVLKEIMESNNKANAFSNALTERKITYKALGFMNKVRFMFVSTFVKIAGKFTNDESTESDSAEVEVIRKEGLEEQNTDSESDSDNNDVTGDDGENSFDETDSETSDNNNEETETNDTDDTDETETDDNQLTGNTVAVVESKSKTHIVDLIDGGFDVDPTTKSISIAVGDTVEWKNIRDGSFKKAMIIGTRNCNKIKSKIYDVGESYSWKFDQAGTCLIADGIYTRQAMSVIVG